ncbi:MAG: hypothetical protein ABI761_19095 [Saprospiraceae bacterium]
MNYGADEGDQFQRILHADAAGGIAGGLALSGTTVGAIAGAIAGGVGASAGMKDLIGG